MYGTLYGIYSVFFYLGQFLSGFVAQPLIDMSGTYYTVFIFEGVYGIIMAVIFAFIIFGKKLRVKPEGLDSND